MLYVIKGGKYTPFEIGYKSEFYLLSFDKDARNNKGYIRKLEDDTYKLYFKWDWNVIDKNVARGKNYKYFEQFDYVIKFLLDIKFCEAVSLAWLGGMAVLLKL